MNRIHEILSRHLYTDKSADEALAARVLASLATSPLPAQRHSLFKSWPAALLNIDFAPAWPRLAALACVTLLGCMIGFFGPGAQFIERSSGAAASMQVADSDAGTIAFEPEPLTGVRP